MSSAEEDHLTNREDREARRKSKRTTIQKEAEEDQRKVTFGHAEYLKSHNTRKSHKLELNLSGTSSIIRKPTPARVTTRRSSLPNEITEIDRKRQPAIVTIESKGTRQKNSSEDRIVKEKILKSPRRQVNLNETPLLTPLFNQENHNKQVKSRTGITIHLNKCSFESTKKTNEPSINLEENSELGENSKNQPSHDDNIQTQINSNEVNEPIISQNFINKKHTNKSQSLIHEENKNLPEKPLRKNKSVDDIHQVNNQINLNSIRESFGTRLPQFQLLTSQTNKNINLKKKAKTVFENAISNFTHLASGVPPTPTNSIISEPCSPRLLNRPRFVDPTIVISETPKNDKFRTTNARNENITNNIAQVFHNLNQSNYSTPTGAIIPNSKEANIALNIQRKNIIKDLSQAGTSNNQSKMTKPTTAEILEEIREMQQQTNNNINRVMEQMLQFITANQQSTNTVQGASSNFIQQPNNDPGRQQNENIQNRNRNLGGVPPGGPDDNDDGNGDDDYRHNRFNRNTRDRNFHDDSIDQNNFQRQNVFNNIDRDTKEMIHRQIKNIQVVSKSTPSEIAAFIKQADVAYLCINTDNEDRYFTRELKTKMARIDFISLDEITNAHFWYDLKKILTVEYKATNSKNALEAKLDGFRQLHTETVDEYGARARKLLHEFELFHAEKMTHELKERISSEILVKFALNMRNPKVREALKYRGGSLSLPDAVNYAIEQDAYHRNDDIDREVICAYCGARGHKNESCHLKERDIRSSNHAAGNQAARTCGRCGYIGHSNMHCVVRIPNNNNNSARTNGTNNSDNFNNRNSSQNTRNARYNGPSHNSNNNFNNNNNRGGNGFNRNNGSFQRSNNSNSRGNANGSNYTNDRNGQNSSSNGNSNFHNNRNDNANNNSNGNYRRFNSNTYYNQNYSGNKQRFENSNVHGNNNSGVANREESSGSQIPHARATTARPINVQPQPQPQGTTPTSTGNQ